MCGIVGAYSLDSERPFDPARLDAMAASVRHRGPDDAYAWRARGIAIATQRLALTDAANGRQPLSDPSGRVHVAFNGELYEHDALREALVARGHVFRTRCDTELWPALHIEHGLDAFQHARGQFAVAIHDRASEMLVLARDSAGIVPLFYAIADGFLLFASEVKALFASGLVEPRLYLPGVDRVFSTFAMGLRDTCFEGVRSVAPGHRLVVKDGNAAEARWSASEEHTAGVGHQTDDDAVRELHELLLAAVRRRLVSDGDVAAYLSSGLDSPLIVALAQSLRRGDPLRTFTVGFRDAGTDESREAARIAARLGTRHETVYVDAGDVVNALPTVVEAAESPIMDMADACVLAVARRVRDRGMKAVLSGEGADEGLGGYIWHRTGSALASLDARAPGIPRAIRSAATRLVGAGPRPSPFARFERRRPSIFDLYEPLSAARFLYYSDAMADVVANLSPTDELELDLPPLRDAHVLERSLSVERRWMLAGHLLTDKGDRMAMRAGVETRYPFLDESLVRFFASLAPTSKLRAGEGKWLLRALGRSLLPAELATRRKTMFRARALAELSAHHPSFVAELVSPESLRRTGYFSPDRVAREARLRRVLPTFAPRRLAGDGAFTAVVTTQLLHHLFLGGGLCSLPSWSPPGTETSSAT